MSSSLDDDEIEFNKVLELFKKPIWRLNALYHILDKDGFTVPFKFNPCQREFYGNMHYLNCILKARQLGMSTLIAMILLDACLFNNNVSCGIIDKTIDDAKDKLKKIRFAYEKIDTNEFGDLRILMGQLKERIKLVKDSSLELEFSNGSSIRCGVSLRGGTFQMLHISEFGYVCNSNPLKSNEIMSGAINTVSSGNFIFLESTFEGGKNGHFYEICKSSLEHQNEKHGKLDWKFHFFPWFKDKKYRIQARPLDYGQETINYFNDLKKNHNIDVSNAAKLWYYKKRNTLGDLIYQQFPSTPSECWMSSNKGSIYQEIILSMYSSSQIIDFSFHRDLPVYTFWDIGFNDSTAIWAVQFLRNEIYWIDHYENNGEPASFYASKILDWKSKGYNIVVNYLPHDAGYADKGSGNTYLMELDAVGLSGCELIPRTRDIWLGINKLRSLLKSSYIHKTNCRRGIDCLEAYRKRYNESLGSYEQPLHDWSSNSADAARYVAEALMNNILHPITGKSMSYRIKGNAKVKRRGKPTYL